MDYLKRIWKTAGALTRKEYLKPISVFYTIIWSIFILYGTFELLTYLFFNLPHIFDSYTRSFIFWRLKNDLPIMICLITALLLNIRFYPFVQDYLKVRIFVKADFTGSVLQFQSNFKQAYNEPSQVTKKTYAYTNNRKNILGDEIQAQDKFGSKRFDIAGKPIYETETVIHETYEKESKLTKGLFNEKNEDIIYSGAAYVFKLIFGTLFFLFAWNVSFIMGWFVVGKYID